MFNLLFLIPQVFTVGGDIMACLDGQMTEDDYNKLVDDFSNLVLSIPELSGFVAIIQSLLKVAKVAYPLIQTIQGHGTDKPQLSPAMMAIKAKLESDLSEEDIARGGRSLKLMIDVSKKLAASEQVEPEKADDVDFDASDYFKEP
jgi:hypothetical protein